MKKTSLTKLFIAFTFILLALLPVKTFAQDQQPPSSNTNVLQEQQQPAPSDYFKGKIDGERDATGNALWIAGGCCITLGVGVIAAYIIKPEPSGQAFIGKSSEYIMGYTDGYKDKSRDKNAMYALGGCVGTGLVWVFISMANSKNTVTTY